MSLPLSRAAAGVDRMRQWPSQQVNWRDGLRACRGKCLRLIRGLGDSMGGHRSI